LNISTDALLLLGVSGAGVCPLRGATGFSREAYWSSANVDRDDGVVWSARYDREARVVPPMVVGGDVGDGMFGEYDGDETVWPFPFMAARCDEERTALSAALAGSNVCSIIDRSWLGCVGEVAFCAGPPSAIFLVEYCRFRAALDGPAVDGVAAGGEMIVS